MSEIVPFWCGNPAVEVIEGTLVVASPEEAVELLNQKPLDNIYLLCRHIPTQLNLFDLLNHVLEHGSVRRKDIQRLKVVLESSRSFYSVILLLSVLSANSIVLNCNGKKFPCLYSSTTCFGVITGFSLSDNIRKVRPISSFFSQLPSHCSICLEELDCDRRVLSCEPDTLVDVLCGHVFHSTCLSHLESPSCPMCRAQTQPECPIACTGCGETRNLLLCAICGSQFCLKQPSGPSFEKSARVRSLEIRSIIENWEITGFCMQRHFAECSHNCFVILERNELWELPATRDHLPEIRRYEAIGPYTFVLQKFNGSTGGIWEYIHDHAACIFEDCCDGLGEKKKSHRKSAHDLLWGLIEVAQRNFHYKSLEQHFSELPQNVVLHWTFPLRKTLKDCEDRIHVLQSDILDTLELTNERKLLFEADFRLEKKLTKKLEISDRLSSSLVQRRALASSTSNHLILQETYKVDREIEETVELIKDLSTHVKQSDFFSALRGVFDGETASLLMKPADKQTSESNSNGT